MSCVLPTVNVRACVFNESGEADNSVRIHAKMINPPPSQGIFSNDIQTFVPSGGVVILSNLYQEAWYQIWRNRSAPVFYRVPVTLKSQVDFDAVLLGNDELDQCLTITLHIILDADGNPELDENGDYLLDEGV